MAPPGAKFGTDGVAAGYRVVGDDTGPCGLVFTLLPENFEPPVIAVPASSPVPGHPTSSAPAAAATGPAPAPSIWRRVALVGLAVVVVSMPLGLGVVTVLWPPEVHFVASDAPRPVFDLPIQLPAPAAVAPYEGLAGPLDRELRRRNHIPRAPEPVLVHTPKWCLQEWLACVAPMENTR